jgi:hypothetical protein
VAAKSLIFSCRAVLVHPWPSLKLLEFLGVRGMLEFLGVPRTPSTTRNEVRLFQLV